MFLRKLTVMVVPLLLLALLWVVVPRLTGMGFWSPVLQGLLIGVALALLLPLSGATRRKEPFGKCLWVPCAVCAVLLAAQYAASVGLAVPVLLALASVDGQVVLMESLLMAYMGVTALRN